MDTSLPGLILTGASGFVGRNFIKAAAGRFRLFCIARRSVEEAGVQPDANLRWLQVDISQEEKVMALVPLLREHGGVDYVVNLAGYYDFTNRVHPEYVRTNIWGTKNMLELAKELGAKRFLFASSQAACRFGSVVTETTPPDAEIPYAQSKKAGEELVREYAQWVPGTIVRIAAVFSDWCEYPPLYTMLNNWCSGKFLESHIIAGRGRSAIPYIHVQDLVQLFLRVIEKNDELERLCTFNAGPDGAVSHQKLYSIATQFYYSKPIKPLFVPKWLLFPMIVARLVQCHLLGKQSFEQLWMLDYIDRQLFADSSYTRKVLSWKPTPRKSITRRLVFMVENMKKNPDLWRNWNEAMLHKGSDRPHLVLHDLLCSAMSEIREETLEQTMAELLASEPDAAARRHPSAIDHTVLQSFVRLLYQLIVAVLRTRNLPMMQQYVHTIAFIPLNAGFSSWLVSQGLHVVSRQMIQRLRSRDQFQNLTSKADEYVTRTILMAVDQIEDQIELARLQSPILMERYRHMPPPLDNSRLEAIVLQLEDVCLEAMSGQSWTSPLVNHLPLDNQYGGYA